MHEVAIRPEIIERVLARRGRLHLYDRLEAQIRSGPNRPGVISLRSEQAAVMQRIREEVLFLAGDIPPEIALLLTSAGSTQPVNRAAAGAPL